MSDQQKLVELCKALGSTLGRHIKRVFKLVDSNQAGYFSEPSTVTVSGNSTAINHYQAMYCSLLNRKVQATDNFTESQPYKEFVLACDLYISDIHCWSYTRGIYYFLLHSYGQKYASMFIAATLGDC